MVRGVKKKEKPLVVLQFAVELNEGPESVSPEVLAKVLAPMVAAAAREMQVQARRWDPNGIVSRVGLVDDKGRFLMAPTVGADGLMKFGEV